MQETLGALHQLMWDYVGILRHESGLRHALSEIEMLATRVEKEGWRRQVPLGVELGNRLIVARQVTQAALAREESRGAHCRTDFPDTLTQPAQPGGLLSASAK